MSSTFAGFYIAKAGIQNARANLQIVGQNMTNENTTGYTKQSVSSSAISASSTNTRYASSGVSTGNGVASTGVTQSRDVYLDAQYRTENAQVSETSVEVAALTNVDTVLDENINSGIQTNISNLVTQLQTFAATPSSSSLESVVKNSSKIVAKSFNSAATQLSEIRTDQTEELQDGAVTSANSLLKDIASLNEQIKTADISGASCLELKDQRNLDLDQLSQYMNIKVTTTSVNVGSTENPVNVDEVSVSLVGDDGTKTELVNNDSYNQIGMTVDSDTGAVTISLNKSDGTSIDTDINDQLTTGSIGGYLSLLNDSGEYDTPATETRGLGYYEKALDTLASDFAETLNTANSTDSTGTNKPLFAASDGSSTITAANISISDEWTDSDSYMTTTKETATTGSGTSSDGSNILSMINQISASKSYTTADGNATSGTALFSSSIDGYMSEIVNSVLALQVTAVKSENSTDSTALDTIDTNRASVSSVDINEESINLIKYNQALSASSRFMTTMDEVLDTIINNMGVIS